MSLNVKGGKAVTGTSVPKNVPQQSELALAVAKIQKELGPKAIVRGSEIVQVRRLPTGIFEFDFATGGGFPFNRYSIVYGPESSCKTNIVYKAIAAAQRLPPPCNKAVLVDAEGTFDPDWAARHGVDVDALMVVKPSYGEQAVDMIDALVRASDVAFLGLDSLATLIAAKEVEGSTEKADVGTSALLIKRLSNKMAVALSEEQKRGHDICVVFINQRRFKIGVMFGDPETMPGGQTVKFNASLIVRVYGTDVMVPAISADRPAFKKIVMVVKKAKVGIVKKEIEFNMAVMDHDGVFIGESDSFEKVKGYLQASGHLSDAKGKGYVLALDGQEPIKFDKISTLRDTYQAESEFSVKLQQQIVANHKLSLVAAENLTEPDPQPAPVAVAA